MRRCGLHVGEMTMTANINVEAATIAGTSLTVSRVGLGTWAIGGWMWGGTDEDESIKTIHAAVERGINLIDTAPAYGGHSEEIVGATTALWGARHPGQLQPIDEVFGWSLDAAARRRSSASCGSRLPIRSAPHSWRRRRAAKQRSWKRRSNQEAQI
jgi:hypothetical protein